MNSIEEVCRVYESAALREAGRGVIRPGGPELTQRALAVSTLSHGSRVLDIGCGTGISVHYLKESCGFRAVGIDLSMLLLAAGQEEAPGRPLARATGACLPFADAVMDGVLAECSLSVMEDVRRTLDECSRVLKPEGILLVHDVYARNPKGCESLRALPIRCCLQGAVSKEEWIARLEEHRFSVTLWQDHSFILGEFAARLIFSYGSLEAFWCHTRNTSETESNCEIQTAVASGRPGYFLMMAKKLGSVSCKE